MAPTSATQHGLSRSLPDPASDCTASCILVFSTFLNAYLVNTYARVYVYVCVCVYLYVHAYVCTLLLSVFGTAISRTKFVHSLHGRNKEFCSVLFCTYVDRLTNATVPTCDACVPGETSSTDLDEMISSAGDSYNVHARFEYRSRV